MSAREQKDKGRMETSSRKRVLQKAYGGRRGCAGKRRATGGRKELDLEERQESSSGVREEQRRGEGGQGPGEL